MFLLPLNRDGSTRSSAKAGGQVHPSGATLPEYTGLSRDCSRITAETDLRSMPHLEISARPLRWCAGALFVAASITENNYLRARRNFRSSGAPGGRSPPASHDFIMTLPQGYRTVIQEGREGSVAGPEAANLHCPRAWLQPEHHDTWTKHSISGRYQRTSHQKRRSRICGGASRLW